MKLAFFDSMTFNGSTGGSKMGILQRSTIRKTPEKLGLIESIKSFKQLEAPYYFDKLSYADFV